MKNAGPVDSVPGVSKSTRGQAVALACFDDDALPLAEP